MNRILIVIGAIIVGIGFLLTFPTVFSTYDAMDSNQIQPVTDNTTAYTTSEGTIPNYNQFEYAIMHNLVYIVFGIGAVCVIIGLGKMGGD